MNNYVEGRDGTIGVFFQKWTFYRLTVSPNPLVSGKCETVRQFKKQFKNYCYRFVLFCSCPTVSPNPLVSGKCETEITGGLV